MKKLEKLTLEQEQKLEFYKNKWLNKIFNYELYNTNTFESVKEKMKELYKFCNLNEPIVLFLNSPLACQLGYNLFKNLNLNQVGNQVGNQVENQVWNQVGNQIGNQVENQVWNQVLNQVKNQVENQVWNQVGNQVLNQVWNQVKNQVWNQVGNQVWNQVGNQVENQVWNQVENQVKNQVGNQVLNQVWNQVLNQVGNQVWNQVWNQVLNQVKNQVGNQVGNQVKNQVLNQVGNQVWNQVGNQIGNQVENQVKNQVWNQVWNQIKFENFSSYINYSDFGWLSFYKFFNNETDILKEFTEQLKTISSFVDCSFMQIQLDGLCIVSKYPCFISKNNNNEMHNINEYAIRFDDGYGQHYFNGVFITPELFVQLISKSYTFEQWTKEKNEEIKSLVLAFYEEKFGGEFVFRFLSEHLKEIDTYIDKKDPKYLENTTKSMNIGVYTLFKGNVNNINIAYVRCYCPSTDRLFFLGVHSDFENAQDAIASLCQIPNKLKDNLISINRQGEIFSFNFDEIGTKMLKNQELNKEDYQDVISLKGLEYFSKLKYEY